MYQYNCKIIKIVDGDTVDVDIDLGFNVVLRSHRVRLRGIDTPESRTSDQEEKKWGLLSKRKLEEKLPVGSYTKINTFKADSNDDKFGRILAEFILDNGTNVNKWLIENNYAAVYEGQSKEFIRQIHLSNRKAILQRGEVLS